MRRVALLLVAATAPFATAAAQPRAALPLSAFPRETIAVETRGVRRHVFEAWRADTPWTRAQGLMYVRGIEPRQAMIFVYEPAQPVSMWMKNTLLPRDMLFVDEAGCVVKVHERARPGSLETIASDVPVAWSWNSPVERPGRSASHAATAWCAWTPAGQAMRSRAPVTCSYC